MLIALQVLLSDINAYEVSCLVWWSYHIRFNILSIIYIQFPFAIIGYHNCEQSRMQVDVACFKC